jgi:hypothetical protein
MPLLNESTLGSALKGCRACASCSIFREMVCAVVDFATFQVVVEPRAVHHGELTAKTAQEGRQAIIDKFVGPRRVLLEAGCRTSLFMTRLETCRRPDCARAAPTADLPRSPSSGTGHHPADRGGESSLGTSTGRFSCKSPSSRCGRRGLRRLCPRRGCEPSWQYRTAPHAAVVACRFSRDAIG